MEEKEKTKLNNFHDLVDVTVKDLVDVRTMISDDYESINIGIQFGSVAVLIPIKVRDIIANQQSPKNFIALIREPLEATLNATD